MSLDTWNPYKCCVGTASLSNSSVQKVEAGDPGASVLARSSVWVQLKEPTPVNKGERNQGSFQLQPQASIPMHTHVPPHMQTHINTHITQTHIHEKKRLVGWCSPGALAMTQSWVGSQIFMIFSNCLRMRSYSFSIL